MINGNDGGATISTDGGESWTTEYNQPTAQFYHVASRQSLPLLHLRRAAGQLHRRHRQRRARRHHRSLRLVRRGRRRERLHRARSHRSEHRVCRLLRRRDHALRSPHASGAGGQSLAHQSHWLGRGRPEAPLPVDRADRLFAARSQDAVLRAARCCSRRPTAE